ncbi:MAG: EamA family transporter [Acidimicrobiales bacterium]
MAIVLSLLTALFFGAGDFAGGMATKQTKALLVVLGSHVVGLVGVVIGSVLIADEFTVESLAIGAAAGVFGAIGVFFLYRRLAEGPMAVVAPITAITSAVVPVVADLVGGGGFGPLLWFGIGLGLVAIACISIPAEHQDVRVTGQVIGESLLAGVGFGLFFVFVDLAENATAPWPIVGARLTSVVVIGAWVVVAARPTARPTNTTIGWIVMTGILDTLSNVLFLYAVNIGELGVVSVLSSLYPASTAVLARVVLGERLSRVQLLGFALALTATTVIAVA